MLKPTGLIVSIFCFAALFPAGSAFAAVRGDFNGDGYFDLVVGIIREDVSGQSDAGSVQIIYGSPNGLVENDSSFWHQDQDGVNNAANADDHFGAAICAGDFDGDGFDDLAIGVPDEDISGQADAGAVHVLYGSSEGIRSSGDQFWHQDSSGVNDLAEAGDRFGAALAAGDFNGDGRDDLAIGVPGEDFGFLTDAGIVSVLYGSSSKLRSSGDQVWNQDKDGINGVSNDFDGFGSSLASGNFNGDDFDDLAIGVPGEDINFQADAGAVNVLYGSSQKLRKNQDQYWHQDSTSINDLAEGGDAFGTSLITGDFNGDGRDDLAIAVPLEDVGPIIDAGAVHVLYGKSTGLSSSGDQLWQQDAAGILDAAEDQDQFGNAIIAGDFDNDGFDDLAVGIEKEDLDIKDDAGAVHIIYGSSSKLSASGDQLWHQDSAGVIESNQNFDNFGRAITAGDYDGDGRTDLAIAVPSEDTGGNIDSGAVLIMYGTSSGIGAGGDQLWHQDSDGISDSSQESDFFGDTLGR